MFTNDELNLIKKMNDDRDIYTNLASQCICPSVSGHLEIKKGILLMLFGGVNK
jgi:DNA replication licensing factor MCM6